MWAQVNRADREETGGVEGRTETTPAKRYTVPSKEYGPGLYTLNRIEYKSLRQRHRTGFIFFARHCR